MTARVKGLSEHVNMLHAPRHRHRSVRSNSVNEADADSETKYVSTCGGFDSGFTLLSKAYCKKWGENGMNKLKT